MLVGHIEKPYDPQLVDFAGLQIEQRMASRIAEEEEKRYFFGEILLCLCLCLCL